MFRLTQVTGVIAGLLLTGVTVVSADTRVFAPVVDSVPGAAQGDTGSGRSPVVALAASALVPGAGQVYNRMFVKGGLILGAQASMMSYTLVWAASARGHDVSIRSLEAQVASRTPDSLEGELRGFFDTPAATMQGYRALVDSWNTALVERAPYSLALDTARFNRLKKRSQVSQGVTWGAGLYLYALMDAIDKTGRFGDTAPRNPTRAGALSAIPGLALGQIYNRSLAKAGLIWMVQGGLGVLVYNYHRQMRVCERNLERIGREREGYYGGYAGMGPYDLFWRMERSQAFNSRNTYLWYSVFFYFFSIFDAVVDAHLSDFPDRIRLEPDLTAMDRGRAGAAGLKATFVY